LQIPLQITWRNVPKSEALEADIEAKAEKLEEFYDHIMSCRVVVEKSHGRHKKGNLFRIRLDIKVPDNEIVVTRDPAEDHAHEDMYVTIRDAFDAARRQLQDYVRVRRGQVKHHDEGYADPEAVRTQPTPDIDRENNPPPGE
jgi:ribosomal subunit interface protein